MGFALTAGIIRRAVNGAEAEVSELRSTSRGELEEIDYLYYFGGSLLQV